MKYKRPHMPMHIRNRTYELDHLVKTISQNIRSSDKLYRYGGEEFVVLLPETGEQEAKEVAEKIRSKVAKKRFKGVELSQPNLIISISVGIASYPKNGITSSEIVFAADAALYEAKTFGKNTARLAKTKT